MGLCGWAWEGLPSPLVLSFVPSSGCSLPKPGPAPVLHSPAFGSSGFSHQETTSLLLGSFPFFKAQPRPHRAGPSSCGTTSQRSLGCPLHASCLSLASHVLVARSVKTLKPPLLCGISKIPEDVLSLGLCRGFLRKLTDPASPRPPPRPICRARLQVLTTFADAHGLSAKHEVA